MSCEYSTNRDFTKIVPITPTIPDEIRPLLRMNNTGTRFLFLNKPVITVNSLNISVIAPDFIVGVNRDKTTRPSGNKITEGLGNKFNKIKRFAG